MTVPSVCGYCRAERPDAEAMRFHVIAAHDNGGFAVSDGDRAEARKREDAIAAKASFGEDHSLRHRSWGRGRHGSIPTTEGAEGRNWVGD